MGRILVIGSSNTDLITKVRSFPKAGETIEGLSFLQAMGGKGANQAVAAHRLGGDVAFITSLGKDANGQNSMDYYKTEGLDVSASLMVDDTASGAAVILVDKKGENCIVIAPGANQMLSPEYIEEVKQHILDCDLVVLQMEIPYDTVKKVCEIAYAAGKTIMLNVAPARVLDPGLIKMVDILVVNETEAETISGKSIEKYGQEVVVDSLLQKGAKTVVLTLGKQGCFLKNDTERCYTPAFEVRAVDSTAAGDTFCGALAVGLTRGRGWQEALKFASAASAICVTRMGAQPSIPFEKEVRSFLVNHAEIIEK